MGAAFDMPMIALVADVISTEARAFSNGGRCGLNFWTPNINPYRDPRWGRGQEVPSEDAFFISEYVKRLIPGLQGGTKGDPYWKLVATCKHYAGYDIESKSCDSPCVSAPVGCKSLADRQHCPLRSTHSIRDH